jgi:tetratricopeptide (TPR) repeat protein
MVAKLINWIFYAFGIWVFLSFIADSIRWAAVFHAYGGIPISLMRQMIAYTTKNYLGKQKLWVACSLGSISALFVARSVMMLVSPAVDRGAAVAWIVLALSIGMVLSLAMPPCVLLLGSSHPAVILTKSALNNVKRQYSVVSLLRPGEEVPRRYLAKFGIGDLRTTNSYEWRMVVHHLMDVVPAIIFDDISVSPLSTAELDRIRRRDLTYKVVFLREVVRERFSELTPDTMLAEQLSQSFIELAAGSAETGQEFRRDGRGYGMQVRHHEDLAVRLMHKVHPLLAKRADLARRKGAQREYCEMTRAVPSRYRFSAEPEAMAIRYRLALQWHLRRYCETCKGMAAEETVKYLLEDIPAVVSAEAERQFFQQSRGLDESESIAISFLEMAQEERYGFLTSHKARGHLMVGQAARYRQDWDASLHHLSRALEEFSAIDVENTADFSSLSNLALTHFVLGEVHMARYRALEHAGDRTDAMDHFRHSIKIESRLGSKDQSAQSRLEAMAVA